MHKKSDFCSNCLHWMLFLILVSMLALPGQRLPANQGALFSAVGAQALRLQPDFGKMPLYFIENQGQIDRQVSYYLRGKDKTIYFTPAGLTYSLHGGEQVWNLKLDFLGARRVVPVGQARTPAIISYFKGAQEKWQTGLPTFGEVIYKNLWPGIDLIYSGTQHAMKYTFLVRPGADPGQIRLAYRGADLGLTAEGALEVSTPVGGFRDAAPNAFQELGGERKPVTVAFDLNGVQYGFRFGAYDSHLPLVIDPVTLVYSGYIGGWGDEEGTGIAVDSSGNAYVVGYAGSYETSGFPVVVGPDLTHGNNYDAFIAKVRADGTGLVYCGFIGGDSLDWANAVALDGSGGAYVVGYTQSTETTFPVAVGPDLTHNGDPDVFVAKVNNSGTDLTYAGYIGGSGMELGYGVDVDASGRAYVTGYTDSSEATFPETGGPDLTQAGGEDGFIARVSADGSGLEYAGYIGGMYQDRAFSVAVDSSSRAYVTGFSISTSTDFPKLVGPDLTHNGGYDAFISRIAADGSNFEYSGYIGGNASEYAPFDVAVDTAGRAVVIGVTSSNQTTFPVKVGPDLTFNSTTYEYDTFIAGVKSDGTGLDFAGYIGGALSDYGSSVAIGPNGDFYVAGYTESDEASFPVLVGPDLTFNGGGADAFITRVKADASGLVYSGFIGGSNIDAGYAVDVDPQGNAYVTGRAQSNETTFPVVVGPYLTLTAGYEVFVTKLAFTLEVNPSTIPSGTVGIAYNQVFSASGGTAPYTFDQSGALPDGISFSTDTLSGTPTQAGDYPITVIVTDTSGITGNRDYTLTIEKGATSTTVASAQNPSTVGSTVTFTATVSGDGGTPTGTVQFKDGGVNLGGPVALVGGIAAYSTASLTVGTHVISAQYSGDVNYLASTGTLSPDQEVGKAAPIVRLYSLLNPSTLGANVQFSAWVSGTVGIPTGGVQFRDNGVAIGTPAALNTSGWAYRSTTALTVGTHVITADYGGDTNYLLESGTLTPNQVVNRAMPNVSVNAAPNPSTYGDSVTFTARVTSTVGSPTGSVQFLDFSSNMGGPVPLVGDTATLITSTLGAAAHFITATYIGDANFRSQSANMTQNVNQATTTTTVSAAPNPSRLGETVTFTATVSSTAGTPPLYVQFKDGGVNLGSAQELVNGVVVYSTALLSVGTHTISADYLGSPNFLVSSGVLPGGQVVENPGPQISRIEPNGAVVGGGAFSITISGSYFTLASTVEMTGDLLSSTYVSSTRLTASVPAVKIAASGAFPVTVTNPPPTNEGTSTPAFIFVTESGAEVTDYDLDVSSDPGGTATASTGGSGAGSPGSLTATASGAGSVVVARYESNPGGTPSFSSSGSYMDVSFDPSNSFTSVTIEYCDLGGGSQVYWWDGAAWALVSNQIYNASTLCVTMVLDATTSPNLADMTGTPFGVAGTTIYLPLIRKN